MAAKKDLSTSEFQQLHVSSPNGLTVNFYLEKSKSFFLQLPKKISSHCPIVSKIGMVDNLEHEKHI